MYVHTSGSYLSDLTVCCLFWVGLSVSLCGGLLTPEEIIDFSSILF